MDELNKKVLEFYRIESENDKREFLRKSREIDYLLGTLELKGLKGFLAKYFGIGIPQGYSAKTYREINEVMKKIKKEEAEKEEMFEKQTKEFYNRNYLYEFFKKENVPNKEEFNEIKDIVNGKFNTMLRRIEGIRDLVARIKIRSDAELKFLKRFRIAFNEDRRKGYIAHCIDYNGLSEEKVLELSKELDNCISNYALPNAKVA